MNNSTPLVKVGKNLDDAINEGLAELGLTRDEAEIEIIDEGSKGFLGIGGKEACVRIYGKMSAENRAIKFLSMMVSRICDDVEYETEKDSMDHPSGDCVIAGRSLCALYAAGTGAGPGTAGSSGGGVTSRIRRGGEKSICSRLYRL